MTHFRHRSPWQRLLCWTVARCCSLLEFRSMHVSLSEWPFLFKNSGCVSIAPFDQRGGLFRLAVWVVPGWQASAFHLQKSRLFIYKRVGDERGEGWCHVSILLFLCEISLFLDKTFVFDVSGRCLRGMGENVFDIEKSACKNVTAWVALKK